MKTFNEFNNAFDKQELSKFTASLSLQESSEWETRHQEFVDAGNNATPEHIDSLLKNLKDASKKASGKRGVINSIFGKKSNGDYARSAYAADHYHASISKLKNSAKDTEDRKTLGQHITYAKSLLNRMNESEEGLDEADFASMASQLKKYGGKEEIKDTPKKAQSRSSVASDYTMTGHKEKQVATGKQYHKVLPDYDDEDEVKAAKKSTVAGEEPQEKRGRGRPKGVGAKSGFYKPRDPAKKAESAAKAAATKAANKAAKAALTKEDCDEIFEGLDFNDMIEFMLEEDVVALDELSKGTLGSYIKKAAKDLGSKNFTSGFYDRDAGDDGKNLASKRRSYGALRLADKRQRGIDKAVGKLTKEESEQSSNAPEINESNNTTVAYYAARINTNLIKE